MRLITDGVAMLELSIDLGEYKMEIHPTLVWDDKDVILVDTGFPGMLPALQAEMESAGAPMERLTKVILTHQDFDHMGGLPDILAAVDRPVEVYAHAADKPYIEGHIPLLKHDPSQGQPPTAHVDTVIDDGDVLPTNGGLQVIFTPGHTPGHMSLYHLPSHTLITGDATVSESGELRGPNLAYTPDVEKAWQSFGRFADFDVQQAVCYHGGLCAGKVNEQIRALSAQASV